MGRGRAVFATIRDAFSIERATMARLIRTDMPEAAKGHQE